MPMQENLFPHRFQIRVFRRWRWKSCLPVFVPCVIFLHAVTSWRVLHLEVGWNWNWKWNCKFPCVWLSRDYPCNPYVLWYCVMTTLASSIFSLAMWLLEVPASHLSIDVPRYLPTSYPKASFRVYVHIWSFTPYNAWHYVFNRLCVQSLVHMHARSLLAQSLDSMRVQQFSGSANKLYLVLGKSRILHAHNDCMRTIL